MLVKCDKCNGTKKTRGRGSMEYDCLKCNMTGYIRVEKKDDELKNKNHSEHKKEKSKEGLA